MQALQFIKFAVGSQIHHGIWKSYLKLYLMENANETKGRKLSIGSNWGIMGLNREYGKLLAF